MLEFLVQRVLVLHSPSVLYAALSKLTSGLSILGMLEFLVLETSFLTNFYLLYKIKLCLMLKKPIILILKTNRLTR